MHQQCRILLLLAACCPPESHNMQAPSGLARGNTSGLDLNILPNNQLSAFFYTSKVVLENRNIHQLFGNFVLTRHDDNTVVTAKNQYSGSIQQAFRASALRQFDLHS
jgi:hypothetical protein